MDQPTDQPTTRLLELLRAAKNLFVRYPIAMFLSNDGTLISKSNEL